MEDKYINVDVYNDGLYFTFVCDSVKIRKMKKMRFPKHMQKSVVDEIWRFFAHKIVDGKMIDWHYEKHDADVT